MSSSGAEVTIEVSRERRLGTPLAVREKDVDLPITCTLTPAEIAERRAELLPGFLARAVACEPIPGGLRWRLEPHTESLTEAAAVIDAERRCCRFLRFALLVEPYGGPVWLEVTGPEGTASFLATLLETLPAGSRGA